MTDEYKKIEIADVSGVQDLDQRVPYETIENLKKILGDKKYTELVDQIEIVLRAHRSDLAGSGAGKELIKLLLLKNESELDDLFGNDPGLLDDLKPIKAEALKILKPSQE